LVHILAAIDTISSMLANKKLENFTTDIPLRLAVERAFEIISEASRRIPENVKVQEEAIDWKRMVDLGNLLRHAYHRVDPNLLWQMAERDLPPLKAFVDRAIREAER
jgi:uncharacterized protein with HEPN domain